MPILKINSIGASVRFIQDLLHIDPVDGDFGPITQRSVMNFQTLKGLQVDAIVGPRTWEALITT